MKNEETHLGEGGIRVLSGKVLLVTEQDCSGIPPRAWQVATDRELREDDWCRCLPKAVGLKRTGNVISRTSFTTFSWEQISELVIMFTRGPFRTSGKAHRTERLVIYTFISKNFQLPGE